MSFRILPDGEIHYFYDVRPILLPFIVTLSLFLLLQWFIYPLRTDLTPFGIIALEFCDDFQRLNIILNIWDIEFAKIVLYIDFLCVLAFGWLFYTAAKVIHTQCRLSFLNGFTKVAIYITFLPCLLDILGNIFMLITLNGVRNEMLLTVTVWVAIFKFAFAAMVFLYLLVSLLIIYAKTKKSAIRKKEEFFSRP